MYLRCRTHTLLDQSTPTEPTPVYADLLPATSNALRSETPLE